MAMEANGTTWSPNIALVFLIAAIAFIAIASGAIIGARPTAEYISRTDDDWARAMDWKEEKWRDCLQPARLCN